MRRLYRLAAAALALLLLGSGVLLSGYAPSSQPPAPLPAAGWVKDQVLPVSIEMSEADYHLVEGYLNPATFEARAREVQALLDPNVQRDPTKFVTYEQFKAWLEGGETAAASGRQHGGMMGGNAIGLVTFVEQRVANVLQQLDGRLPSKGDGSGMGATSRGAFRPGQVGGNHDQVVPVGVAVLLLVIATGLVWRLRPR